MKIIIVLIIFLELSLFAGVEKMQELYKSGKYRELIKEARKSTDEFTNPKLHFLWAKSAEALGNIDEAMNAYERVLILENDNVEARVALAKIYRETKRDELSASMSKSLKNYQLTTEQKGSLGLLNNDSESLVKISASLSIGHDTNINVNPVASVLDDYYGSTQNEGKLSTMFARITSKLSYLNKFKDRSNWYMRGNLKVYYQNNFDENYYNLFVGTVEAGGGYIGDGYTAYMPIIYDRVNYLDKDLLQQLSLAPMINIPLSKKIILNINAKYTQRTYIEKIDDGKNDIALSVGFGVYYFVDKDFAYFSAKYENFNADEVLSEKFIDKDLLTLSLGVNYNINSWLVGRADYRFRDGTYKDDIGTVITPNTAKRSDEYHQVELKFSHFFQEKYEVYISDRYSKNSSNYIPSEYNKNIVMLGLSLKY